MPVNIRVKQPFFYRGLPVPDAAFVWELTVINPKDKYVDVVGSIYASEAAWQAGDEPLVKDVSAKFANTAAPAGPDGEQPDPSTQQFDALMQQFGPLVQAIWDGSKQLAVMAHPELLEIAA